MCDYEHIPIHLRITCRWLIDPNYHEADYHRREDLIDECKGGGPWARKYVPEGVLAYLYEMGQDTPSDALHKNQRVKCAAAEMQMLPVDLETALTSYTKRLKKEKVRET